jgi:Lysozyme inhibitor LprI
VSIKDVKQDALDNLADALTEDILNTPDDELLREVEEDYGDPRALANKFDQILERAEKQVAASPQARSSFLDLPYRLLEWFLTLFGKLRPAPAMVWAAAAALLIALILAPAVFYSMSKFDERSRQLAAQEKEQLARSEQLAAQERELQARSEQLAAREKELLAISDGLPRASLSIAPSSAAQAQASASAPPTTAPAEAPSASVATEEAPAAQPPTSQPKVILCENTHTESYADLICADADLASWQNLVRELYQHRWRQLDANGQQKLRQAQLDWLRKLRVDCNVPVTNAWKVAEMARARSCVLKSTKKRVAVLSK